MWKFLPKSPFTNELAVYRIDSSGQMISAFYKSPEIQKWVSEGNTPEPADPPPILPVEESIIPTMQKKLDAMEMRLKSLETKKPG